ncbi:UDP-2,3-diacylglucosamine diphosphatase LpxI [Thermodesulfovibrio sp.]|uniref:LpxI family protein n=1 Tax=Thermodesulfovibrio sp. TaxID=2067987 RepID=UPI0030AA831D
MQIGIIAAQGRLPLLIAKELKEKGFKIATIGLEQLASDELRDVSDIFQSINIGQAGKIIDFLKKNNIKELILTGKFPKNLIFQREKIKPDLKAMKMLFSASLRGDNELLKLIDKELQKEGIKIVEIGKICPELLTPEGILTKRKPTKDEWSDIEYGFKIAKKIGELDIGQTVVVKEKSVIAVEAIEGTDETILRAGKYVSNFTVVKTSKPQQELKLDPPVAGMDTIIIMREAKASVLAVEAGRSLLVEREALIKKANELNIAVVGVSHS